MAVAPTGAIYKAMTIDGESSRTYGVYITGSAVYNAPEREVEMISIPGRNGQLALDKGRFENIEVTYPAGIYADTEEDFAEAVSDFRNFLCSRKGYFRIEDEYNPNEYRMGIYKSGFEVEVAGHKAGEFEITFDCKPQRWLKSGETAITVASGDVVSNPTLFESSPMLEVEGYGNIYLNDSDLTINDIPLGRVDLLPNKSKSGNVSSYAPLTISDSYSTASLNTGDAITLSGASIRITQTTSSTSGNKWLSFTAGSSSFFDVSISGVNTRTITVILTPKTAMSFTAGTPTSSTSTSVTFTYTIGDSSASASASFTLSFSYERTVDGNSETLSETCLITGLGNPSWPVTLYRGELSADSTVSILGHPTYIDTDLGEAYKIEDGEVVDLNSRIDLGSDLPVLDAGANTITYDDTITDLKITPRWWKV